MTISQPISGISAVGPVQSGAASSDAAVPLLRRALNAETQEAAHLLATVTPHLGQNFDTLA